MASYHFLSIVGTQIFGTLNPLLSILAEEMPLHTVSLLVTEGVMGTAERIEAFCRQRGLAVDIKTVTTSAASVCDAVHRLLEHTAEDTQWIFNLNGGTNQMIARCSLALLPAAPLLVQSLQNNILLTDTKTWQNRFIHEPECLKAKDVLALQGAEYEQEKTLVTFCRRGNLSLPAEALTFVKMGGITFDLVWNQGGNRLAFLWSGLTEKGGNLEDLRQVTHWAGTREKSGHLFDRRVYAVVDNLNDSEHLKSESNAKVEIIAVPDWRHAPQILRDRLKILFQPQQYQKPQVIQPKKRTAITLEEDTLVLMLGKDPSVTLLCIASHAPRHVVLCHTKELQGQATRVREMASLLGLESVRLVSCDHDGSILLACLDNPERPDRVCVNCTPGLKSQGVFLSLWACRHRCAVWSVEQETASLVRLDMDDKRIPLVTPDPLWVMRARGDVVKADDIVYEEKQQLNDALLKFLHSALHHERAKDVFRMSVKIDGIMLHRPAQKDWELHLADGTVYSFTFAGGEWLELLAARAFEQAGATHVHARVQRHGSSERTSAIQKQYGQNAATFLTDMDVLGGYEGGFFLVSCKANPQTDYAKAAQQARDMSAGVDRFTIPLLCHLGCTEAFVDKESKTQVFGWRELCQPDVLRSFLREQRKRFAVNDR